tara:strand:+ start:256 stop:618 length:363 start_codon:yes stop_codon:yes gene_type:complete
MLAFYLGGFLMAFVFGTIILISDGSPITPEIYGPWVYRFPALMWVALQIFITVGASVFCLFGWRRVSGGFGLFLGVYLAIFAALALGAGAPGTILMTGAGFWLSPLSLMAGGISLWGGDE